MKPSYIIFLLFFCISCGMPNLRKNTILLSEESKEKIISDYLICGECENNELENVLALGKDAIPYLNNVVIYGAPQMARAKAYYYYNSAQKKISSWHKNNNLELSNIEVKREIEYLNESYKIRAIQAIALIDENQGSNFLEKLQENTLENKLSELIGTYLTRLNLGEPLIFDLQNNNLNLQNN